MADFDSNRFQSKRQTYETPEDLFRPIADEFGFTLDVAASSENTKCVEFFDEAVNGLPQPLAFVVFRNTSNPKVLAPPPGGGSEQPVVQSSNSGGVK